jgi:hypothetical protein
MTQPRIDFHGIAKAVHRATKMEIGRTAMNYGFSVLADEIADACERDPKFDRKKFLDTCGLPT